jgi:hypothetical protein
MSEDEKFLIALTPSDCITGDNVERFNILACPASVNPKNDPAAKYTLELNALILMSDAASKIIKHFCGFIYTLTW